MAYMKQTQKMISFIKCEISLGQYVCELVFGVNVLDLDFGVQIDSIEQPIKSNSVGSGNMSHCGASSLHNHLDHCFVVFKHIQQSFLMRRIDVWVNKINIVQISFLYDSGACFQELQRSDPTNQVLGIPSNLNPVSREIISDSVDLCETEVCFLHIHLIGTNV